MNRSLKGSLPVLLRPLVAALAMAGMASSAFAIDIPTGKEDVVINWNTTVKGGLGWRVDKIDPAIGNSATAHQSDYKFPDRWDMWQKRLDVLTEVDVIVKDSYGLRVSAAGWYDGAYSNTDYAYNPDLVAYRAHLGKFDDETKRFYRGPSGEFLDAFVFGTFDLAGRETSVKLGRHALVWGVSQVSMGESVSYSQQPSDLRKAAELPGASPKETALPLPQFSFQTGLTHTLSLSGYYQFDWKPNRLSAGGTFLGSADMLWGTSGGLPVAPYYTMPITDPVTPSSNSGRNFGVQLAYAPDWLEGGNIAVLYRKFDEKQPWALLLNDAIPTGFHHAYARGVEMVGLVSNFAAGGFSAGAEINYTRNGALASQGPGVFGARGDTWHFLLNGQKIIGETALWNSGVLVAEIGYTHLSKVRESPWLYNGKGYGCAGGVDAGCATDNTWTGSLIFQPTWFNAPAPGINLTGSFVLAGYGISGNSANLIGGKEGSYSWSVGVTADVRNKYKIGLQYSDSKAKKPELTTDRGRLNLTFTTTF